MDALDAILRAVDLVAVLGREVPVRLIEISTSGCLLESSSRLEQGTAGVLRVTFEDESYQDDVRIMRCRGFEGSSAVYQIGAEFLWTTRPHERSLRRVITRLQSGTVKVGGFQQQM
jgi:PilZ domain